ncbi:MAG: nicotinate-nucleotide--dimethylbenzimidazole phosphoribosyltransferase, partial [Rhodospirillales bacterium]|nr:nicotinate-nucleotide--dimethylbenzimidazole phosphoribosyltransferase [Rhodospirillales bacterium]
MSQPIAGLAHLHQVMAALPGPDEAAEARWADHEPRLTKPGGALGRLEEIGRWLCTWQGRHPPRLDKPVCRIFAGNHGVAARGVSAFPAEVTVQMVANFQTGGAAINQLCRTFGIELQVMALELDRPTRDFTIEPAMSEAEMLAAFNAGMASVPADADLLCVGEMGIGNTTAAAALGFALFGGSVEDWVGRGTGVDDERLAVKTRVVAEGIALHRAQDPAEILRRLGGRELAAMAGAVLGARLKRVPVLLDGYVCTAAAATLHAINRRALDHCLVAHASAEPGHHRMVGRLGRKPLFDLGM